MRGVLPRAPPLEPCSGVVPYGTSWTHPKGLKCPAEGILAFWSLSQLPTWENRDGFLKPPPLSEGEIMDRNSNLSQRLILALNSDARHLDSVPQSVPALPSPLNLCETSVLQCPSSHSWPPRPHVWQFWTHKAALCLPSRKKTECCPMELPRHPK